MIVKKKTSVMPPKSKEIQIAAEPASDDKSKDIDSETEADSEEDDVSNNHIKRARIVKRRPTFSDKIPAIPVAAFKRLVREVTQDQQLDKNAQMMWTPRAFEALQVGAEAFVVDRFYKAYKRSLSCKKKTVSVSHFD